MKLEFKNQAALLVHFNGRSEVHGDEREEAADIKFRITTENKVLDQLHATLKHALYFHDTANPGRDLMDKAMEDNPEHVPHRRFIPLESPLRWKDEMTGGRLIIHHGLGGRSDLILPDIKVNKVAVFAKDGGTVELEFRVQGKPDEKQAGRLYKMIQRECEITLEAPKADADLAAGGAAAAT